MNKPIIGLSTNLQLERASSREKTVVPTAYVDAVYRTGGIPFLIPSMEDSTGLHELFHKIDGIVLIGGRDVHPRHYSQVNTGSLSIAPSTEDLAHLNLARWAVEEKLPFLAICRGHQVLNVILKGTLIQDIPASVPDALLHTRPADRSQETFHPIHIQENSGLANLLQRTELQVNSSHHQAVDTLGEGLTPTAWAPDDVLEAMELQDHPFGISVQWHPERLLNQNGMHLLFEALIQSSTSKE